VCRKISSFVTSYVDIEGGADRGDCTGIRYAVLLTSTCSVWVTTILESHAGLGGICFDSHLILRGMRQCPGVESERKRREALLGLKASGLVLILHGIIEMTEDNLTGGG
jgi:hypothetical protein